MALSRRHFLRLSVAGSVGAASFGRGFWRALYAAPAIVGVGPYGSIADREPDQNGVILPESFTSKIIGRAGEEVPGSQVAWHPHPDGGCTFPSRGGGWVYVSNSEIDPDGSVTCLRFDAAGEVVGAERLLEGTRLNCAGGPTPWGTWLSCEEFDTFHLGGSSAGRVWECDPTGRQEARVLPAMGAFAHEAAAVDAENGCVYLSEDQPDGRFYRFRPNSWPNLSGGVLEVASEVSSGRVTWLPVPDPEVRDGTPTRHQVEISSVYEGGEGLWIDDGVVFLTTKYDNKVRAFDTYTQRMEVIYDASRYPDAPLQGVDNVTVSESGDAFIAEDGGNMELVMITREREIAPFLRVVGAESSELAGPAFSPDGGHLVVSSLRGGPERKGVTYLITGPFRQGSGGRAGAARDAIRTAEGGGFSLPEYAALGTGALVAVGGAAALLRRRGAALTVDGEGPPL